MAEKPEYKDTYYIVPRRIRDLPGMTLGFLDVYETINQFWNKELPCFLSNAAIAQRTGHKDREIFKALAFLEKNGELVREQRGLKRYLKQPVRRVETDCSNIAKPCTTVQSSTEITQACTVGHPPLHRNAGDPCTGVQTEYKELNIKKFNNIFFTDMIDQRLLLAKANMGEIYSEVEDEEFLNQCKAHDTKRQLQVPTHNIQQRIAGLCKIIAAGTFMPPGDYKSPSKERVKKKESAENQAYHEYSKRIEADINLKLLPQSTKIMGFEEWKLKNKKG